jgi:CBS domain-containing protein
MITVKQLLDAKGYEVWSIAPVETVFDAIKLMAEKEVGALAVTVGDKLVGVITERDYARKVILKGKSSHQTLVREIMTTRVVYARLDQALDECMALMTDKRVRHLPVFEGEKFAGIISIGDLVKAIIAEQQFVIEQLEQYISG